jgi:hypothetical protein
VPFNAAMAKLLTDGTVMVQQLSSSKWWKLKPDASGSYLNGTWSQLAPSSWAPLYYASGILPDGRVIVQGGEYDGGSQSETTKGAVYDPLRNTWTPLTAPTGWSTVGDASGLLLPDGRFMLANCCTAQEAILDTQTMRYSTTGTGKQSSNSEESWALLWDGTVLTVDVMNNARQMESEIYDPATGAWTSAGSTKVVLHDSGYEIGPSLVMYDGRVLATGGTLHTSIYDQATKIWTPGPDFPMIGGKQHDMADAPGAVLPNGNVLLATSPGDYQMPTHFFEFDGSALAEVPTTAHAASDSSYQFNMVVLPTGQVLATDFSNDVELYTPSPKDVDEWKPIIESLPTPIGSAAPQKAAADAPIPLVTLHRGVSYQMWARRLNGMTQGAYYGDDAQAYTNFPLVRLTNMATNHVSYARTHNGSTYAIGPDVDGTTQFDVPADAERGSSTMQIVTNGIASPAVAVEVD